MYTAVDPPISIPIGQEKTASRRFFQPKPLGQLNDGCEGEVVGSLDQGFKPQSMQSIALQFACSESNWPLVRHRFLKDDLQGFRQCNASAFAYPANG
jgi:hypothetical protein